jgi:hypothetical protein
MREDLRRVGWLEGVSRLNGGGALLTTMASVFVW